MTRFYLKWIILAFLLKNNLMIFSYKKSAQNVDLAVIDFDGMIW